jgi:hypothetical protein
MAEKLDFPTNFSESFPYHIYMYILFLEKGLSLGAGTMPHADEQT